MERSEILLPFAAVLIFAPDNLPWQKPVAQWETNDAKQILEDSPWAKSVKLQHVRYLNEFERRDSGNWEADIGPSIGPAALQGLFGGVGLSEAIRRAHQFPDFGSVTVRWESALPVRAAHDKLGVAGEGSRSASYFIIGVYGIEAPNRWNIAPELKRIAFLRRVNKKDIKPSSVEIERHPDGLSTVLYLFPRSEITSRDTVLQFAAQIGELFVAQNFFTAEMQFHERLEL